MKFFLITILLLLSLNMLNAQTKPLPPVELKNELSNGVAIKNFLKTNFIEYDMPDFEAYIHPLGLFKINRRPKLGSEFVLMNIPVTEMFGYVKKDGTTRLYILLKIDNISQYDALFNVFGMPLNITRSELVSRGFETLLWDYKDNYQISLSKHFEVIDRDLKYLCISNIKNELPFRQF